MARRSTAGGSLRKQRRTKIARQKTSKRNVQRKRSPLAELRKQLEHRTYELAESQAQQTATAEVLEVINSSPAKLTPVFEAILQKAHALCNVGLGSLQLYDGEYFRIVATHSFSEQFTELLREGYRPDESFVARSLLKGDRFIQISDADKADFFLLRAAAKLEGIRTVLFVPLRKGSALRGIIVAARREQRLFSDREIRLLENFAAQAVIAIENARLFNETKEALERQTATSDVLAVISPSAGDLQRAFTAMLESAARICDASHATIFLRDGEMVTAAAQLGQLKSTPVGQKTPLGRDWVTGRAILDAETIHVRDLAACDEYPRGKERAIQFGHRATLAVPLVRDGLAIGAILLRRPNAIDFTDKQIELVTNFASQAVIAIENTRLLKELRARTDDLTESLQQQTATSDVLKVIASSPTEVGPVLQAIVESACQLCESDDATVALKDGHDLVFKAQHGSIPIVWNRFPIDRQMVTGRAVIDGRPVHVRDLYGTEGEGFTGARDFARQTNVRTVLSVPLLREGESIGVIALRRTEVKPFSDKQISLLQTFADQAVIAIENTRLFEEVQAKTRDLQEALEHRTSTSEVLNVISRSPVDAAPVFEAIVESAARLCNGVFANVRLYDGHQFRVAATYNFTPGVLDRFLGSHPKVPDRSDLAGRCLLERKVIHVPDVLADPEYGHEMAVAGGWRAVVSVPMLRDGAPIGIIAVSRAEPKPFSDREIDLLTTFADQAVIAIGNVGLFEEVRAKTRDLEEALQQQTASSEVLKVISNSPGDLKPVFEAILENAVRLCEAKFGNMLLIDGGRVRWAAGFDTPAKLLEYLRSPSFQPTPGSHLDRVMRTKRPSHSADDTAEAVVGVSARLGGARSTVCVPMIRDNDLIGAIFMYRTEVEPFTDKQIRLVESFAAQAVIAVQNARLFNETREALERQTATADILKVIAASPSDVQPVFEAIAERSNQLMSGLSAAVYRLIDGQMYLMAFTRISPEADAVLQASFPRPLSHLAGAERIRNGDVYEITDTEQEMADQPVLLKLSRTRGFCSLVFIPLMREGSPIGLISVTRREPGRFADHHVQLLRTFADQAVIAIQNADLFNEVQARTRDLQESLQQQTATADVLKVISRSTFDLPTVLQTLVESAAQLCDADKTNITRERDGAFYRAEAHGFSPEFQQYVKDLRIEAGPGSGFGRALLEGRVVHIPDVLADPEYKWLEGQKLGDYRTVLSVPMLRERGPIGVLTLTRSEVRPFTEKQIELATTFADQAAIAIENVRLFNETTEALERQTATSEVLKVISESPGELDLVFQAMLENGVRLCEAQFAMLFLSEGDQFRVVGKWNLPPAYREFLANNTIPFDARIPVVRAAITKRPVQVRDMLADQSYIERVPVIVAVVELGGARTLLQVPMLKDDVLVGTIAIYRQEVRPFTEKQIALVQNFAAQGVIAIENARLLNELRQRTADLSRSLEDLRTAQDRLVQTEKLASLGQLTAGIAHEIKNPLNFVNNFSVLSAELIDEMTDVLENPHFDENHRRKELDEIRELLKSNLEKVVQHGKRADSIVKNMLLHSRQGSGEHRAIEINALLDESLNLAYHGARAEKQGFNITLERDFDPAAGFAEVFPQEITRVFLNLISNGFYAATKRASETRNGVEPILKAATRSLGDRIEIRIRDNGTGIPPDVKEKIFNPFFTTKPAGEGTGLGLSMSHDIIVKQHGGSIECHSEPGVFTEFVVTLPRTASAQEPAGRAN